ncbi:MAG: transcriptional regulator NrdR [Bifidobacteriaceae bacterium]|nr:transcriptional regulator NrdR [Bifidobacteriaceae bacterium]
MHCPFCHESETKVVDTRIIENGYSIKRRRECLKCKKRFSTTESTLLLVQKRKNNTLEAFDRNKVVNGIKKACQGRNISDADLRALAQKVEEDLRAQGSSPVTSDEVGRAILKPLRQLDEVAYLRFASVYMKFTNIDDFLNIIEQMREEES